MVHGGQRRRGAFPAERTRLHITATQKYSMAGKRVSVVAREFERDFMAIALRRRR